MTEQDRDRLLDHDYDGIEEYDNPLPGWWVWLFWATIVFSAIYAAYYHFGPGPSVIAEYEAETRVAARQAEQEVAKAGPAPAAPTDASIAALQRNPQAMAAAQQSFAVRCAACHGQQGQGLIGPNLTDDHWIHGRGTLTGIYAVISEGVPEKGMVPWKGQLSPDDMQALAAYIATLRGTNPANPKPPQGEKVTGGG